MKRCLEHSRSRVSGIIPHEDVAESKEAEAHTSREPKLFVLATARSLTPFRLVTSYSLYRFYYHFLRETF